MTLVPRGPIEGQLSTLIAFMLGEFALELFGPYQYCLPFSSVIVPVKESCSIVPDPEMSKSP